MLGPLHHVGIVVPSLATALPFYRDAFGADAPGAALTTQDGQARIVFVETGASLIELIEPGPDAADLQAFLVRHPQGGQHHLCYAVPDIHAARAWFADRGATFACPIVTGILGHPIFFVEPDGSANTLTEIIELSA